MVKFGKEELLGKSGLRHVSMQKISGFGYDSTRRLFLLGALGGAAVWRSAAQELVTPGKVADPGCMLTGELEEGPYYLDLELMRRNITEQKAGVPLRLRIAVVDSKSCKPLPNAAVDIWHCDATGLYSGFTASAGGGPDYGRGPRGGGPGFGPPPGPPPDGEFGGRGPGGPGRGRGATDKLTFLRGVQITDKNGMAEFETVYPGWYVGRALHVHTKVHFGGSASDAKYAGGYVAHTGQFFFPEDVTEMVAKLDPYVTHTARRTLNREDGIFRDSQGSGGMLALDRAGEGFVGLVTVAVDPAAEPRGVGMGGRGRGRG